MERDASGWTENVRGAGAVFGEAPVHAASMAAETTAASLVRTGGASVRTGGAGRERHSRSPAGLIRILVN